MSSIAVSAMPQSRGAFSPMEFLVMQRLNGLLLVLGGILTGFYGYLAPRSDGASELADVTRISAAPDRRHHGDSTIIRTFSPSDPTDRQTPPIEGAQKFSTWTTVVTTGDPRPVALRVSAPADQQTRVELARDLQRELTRVGCYHGEINGAWTASTRNAMAMFIDRVNATLPVAQPDYVLLALVQGHGEVACGNECPAGQLRIENGRCVPRAVIAQLSKKSKRAEEQIANGTRFEDNQPPVSEPPEQLPWMIDQAGRQVAAVRPVDLPGRMSIGGPDLALSGPRDAAAASPTENTAPADADAASKLAANGPEPADDAAMLTTDAVDGVALSGDATTPTSKNKSSKSHWRRHDGRANYESAGRKRRGDRRPSLMHSYLMQSLSHVF